MQVDQLQAWVLKSTVFNVSAKVPSLEDFPPLAGVRTKKCVPKEIVRKQGLPTKTGAVLVSGRATVLIVPKINDHAKQAGHLP